MIKNIISGVEWAKEGINALINSNNNNMYLNLLDKDYNKIAFFQANRNNELRITAIHKNNIINNKRPILSINKNNNEFELLWHRRLGHFYNKDLTHGITKQYFWDARRIAKLKRCPHNKETPKAKDILEVIHSDIVGPINESLNNKRYILTFIDEYTRKCWIFTLKEKSDAVNIIISTLKKFNNLFKNNKIKYFKTDKGKEYDNKKVSNFCEKNGIEKIFSIPYNGLAERLNQIILSYTKTILFWSGLSDNFWDFAVQYANYIYNKIPHSGNNNKIPDEEFLITKSKLPI